jgi:hypothetical protein
MADSKITALGSIGTGTDPANDQLVIVDVSDVLPTGMATTGTTKRVGLNQLLSSSPTATGAFSVTGLVTAGSASVTGAATVGTTLSVTGDFSVGTNALKVFPATNRVLINQTTALQGSPLEISALSTADTLSLFGRASDNMSTLTFRANGATTNKVAIQGGDAGFTVSTAASSRLTIDATGVFTFTNVGGFAGTGLTLNATGLGVGVTPASGDGSGIFKAAGTGALTASTRVGLDVRELVSGNQAGIILGAMTTENTGVIGSRTGSGNIAFQTYNGTAWGERARIDYLGNLILTSPSTPPTLATNGQLTVNATSNTNLRFSYRGSDGTTRVANITLA